MHTFGGQKHLAPSYPTCGCVSGLSRLFLLAVLAALVAATLGSTGYSMARTGSSLAAWLPAAGGTDSSKAEVAVTSAAWFERARFFGTSSCSSYATTRRTEALLWASDEDLLLLTVCKPGFAVPPCWPVCIVSQTLCHELTPLPRAAGSARTAASIPGSVWQRVRSRCSGIAAALSHGGAARKGRQQRCSGRQHQRCSSTRRRRQHGSIGGRTQGGGSLCYRP